MPVIIQEVIVEMLEAPASPADAQSPAQPLPAAKAEQQWLKTLALAQQRLDRLKVD